MVRSISSYYASDVWYTTLGNSTYVNTDTKDDNDIYDLTTKDDNDIYDLTL